MLPSAWMAMALHWVSLISFLFFPSLSPSSFLPSSLSFPPLGRKEREETAVDSCLLSRDAFQLWRCPAALVGVCVAFCLLYFLRPQKLAFARQPLSILLLGFGTSCLRTLVLEPSVRQSWA